MTACAARPPIDPCVQAACSEVLVERTEYTPKGLPVFPRSLSERPQKEGDRFTRVQMLDGRPARSYDIVVVGPKGDFTRPFKVIYEWTGRGFAAGARLVPNTLEAASHVHTNDKDAALAMLAIVISPAVVGTAGGFVVGVADGIRTTAKEIGRSVIGKNEEHIAAFTTYEYDDLSRLVLMRMFDAGASQKELVRSDYHYQGTAPEPYRAIISNLRSGEIRIVE